MYFSRFGEMGLGESGLNRVRSSSGSGPWPLGWSGSPRRNRIWCII